MVEEVRYFEEEEHSLNNKDFTDEEEITEEALLKEGIDPVPDELRGAEEE